MTAAGGGEWGVGSMVSRVQCVLCVCVHWALCVYGRMYVMYGFRCAMGVFVSVVCVPGVGVIGATHTTLNYTTLSRFKKLSFKWEAAKIGLVQRTKTVRVDARTLREECNFAGGRLKMKMREEIGKQCKTVLMFKKKGNHACRASKHKRARVA
jgi:hypothetical protein